MDRMYKKSRSFQNPVAGGDSHEPDDEVMNDEAEAPSGYVALPSPPMSLSSENVPLPPLPVSPSTENVPLPVFPLKNAASQPELLNGREDSCILKPQEKQDIFRNQSSSPSQRSPNRKMNRPEKLQLEPRLESALAVPVANGAENRKYDFNAPDRIKFDPHGPGQLFPSALTVPPADKIFCGQNIAQDAVITAVDMPKGHTAEDFDEVFPGSRQGYKKNTAMQRSKESDKPTSMLQRGGSKTSLTSHGSWRRFLPRWRKRSLPQQLCAVVRHGERADTVFEKNGWCHSEDFKLHPNDPPLTTAGKKQAKRVGEILHRRMSDGTSFHIVVTSPYLRCVQTAIEICCALGRDVPLLVDYEMGEIYGPDTMGDIQPNRRSWEYLSNYCAQHDVKVRRRPIGKWPEWPEMLRNARARYANRYLKYVQRSLKVRRNFVLVTHGDAVAAALTVMPSSKDKYIEGVDFCGFFIACRQIDPVEPKAPESSEDTSTSEAEDTAALETKDVEIGKGWNLKKEGIKVSKLRGSTTRSSKILGSKTGSYTSADIDHLLGELPTEVVSNDQLDVLHHHEVSQKDLQERRKKLFNFSRVSLSTFLFGQSECGSPKGDFKPRSKNKDRYKSH
eukprot:gnl/MRDRNA2_/MRDRNA2_136834_c0_seq1.p1 gnl/MRDRNA2_/MRDRNA2_136834_c0~~gnl/MRDRNA2_/MRDRNA2_136834_c0_seq1.p1  ORF type:complete len:617 (+),score=116.61 gnl/MRDRNA2_/MRDRNA2_136834_c0_seq1:157-2007(+)